MKQDEERESFFSQFLETKDWLDQVRRHLDDSPWRLQVSATNLSIFKGDLSDQRHTLVLSPGVGQVKVGERAEVDHVRNVLPQRFVDHVVSPDTLRFRDGPIKYKAA